MSRKMRNAVASSGWVGGTVGPYAEKPHPPAVDKQLWGGASLLGGAPGCFLLRELFL